MSATVEWWEPAGNAARVQRFLRTNSCLIACPTSTLLGLLPTSLQLVCSDYCHRLPPPNNSSTTAYIRNGEISCDAVRHSQLRSRQILGTTASLVHTHPVMIHPNFSHPFPSPLQPHLLQYMHQHQHQPYNQFQPSQ